ncbi:hypothetical protein B0I33_110136 [Prauserella shujinwangii]|uniref:Uncharacterized protein n=1 Tax=Prauserella shujinwangii TaxID=1453103 RepID=A0A2T0LP66_9PSEU|nr:hypothetical protein [Prauserella shujinwangii]PRX45037.1 hypothetical protein B0I33_110136 [Prauserella shujinwangii]
MDAAAGGWSPAPRQPWDGWGELPLGPDASAGDGAVVALGVVCGLRVPWDQSTRQVSFALNEYVDLESGKRVVLGNQRGVTIGERGGSPSDFRGFTEEELRELLVGGLLPDEGDEEDAGESRPWSRLAELAAARGVTVTPEELKALPYIFEFRPAVRALLRTAES